MNSFEARTARGAILTGRLALRADEERAAALREVWLSLWTSRLLVWVSGMGAVAAFGFGPVRHALDLPGMTRGLGRLGELLAAPAARWDAAWYLVIAHYGYRPEFGAMSAPRAAFFPLYPAGVDGLARLGVPPVLAGVVLSLGALAVALYLLYRLTALEVGREAAGMAVRLTALAPMAFYFSAIYSESLYLALSVAVFLCARRGRWAWACTFAALAGATRSTGVVLVVPLALLYLYGPREDRPVADRVRRRLGAGGGAPGGSRPVLDAGDGVPRMRRRMPGAGDGAPEIRRRRLGAGVLCGFVRANYNGITHRYTIVIGTRSTPLPSGRLGWWPRRRVLSGWDGVLGALLPRYRLRRDALWLALVPVGLGLYMAHLALAGGDAFAPFHAQAVWSRRFAGPYGGVWDGARAAFEGARQLLSMQRSHIYFPAAGGSPFIAAGHNLMLFAFLLAAVPMALGVLRRLPLAYGAYVLAALAMPLSYPVAPQPLMSLPRFLVVLFPLNMWLAARMPAGLWARRGVLAASAGAMAFFAAEFATWHWVA